MRVLKNQFEIGVRRYELHAMHDSMYFSMYHTPTIQYCSKHVRIQCGSCSRCGHTFFQIHPVAFGKLGTKIKFPVEFVWSSCRLDTFTIFYLCCVLRILGTKY